MTILGSKCKYETKLAWGTAELHCISLNKSERQQHMLEKKGPKRKVYTARRHDGSLCTQKQRETHACQPALTLLKTQWWCLEIPTHTASARMSWHTPLSQNATSNVLWFRCCGSPCHAVHACANYNHARPARSVHNVHAAGTSPSVHSPNGGSYPLLVS